jgi:hypothetical protein
MQKEFHCNFIAKHVLLAMTRLPDIINQLAVNHVDCVHQVLANYGKTVDNVLYTVADNCPTNIYSL